MSSNIQYRMVKSQYLCDMKNFIVGLASDDGLHELMVIEANNINTAIYICIQNGWMFFGEQDKSTMLTKEYPDTIVDYIEDIINKEVWILN